MCVYTCAGVLLCARRFVCVRARARGGVRGRTHACVACVCAFGAGAGERMRVGAYVPSCVHALVRTCVFVPLLGHACLSLYQCVFSPIFPLCMFLSECIHVYVPMFLCTCMPVYLCVFIGILLFLHSYVFHEHACHTLIFHM